MSCEAIVPDTDDSAEAWIELNKEFAEKWLNITVKGDEPPDADNYSVKAENMRNTLALRLEGIEVFV